MNNDACYRLVRDAGIRSGTSLLPLPCAIPGSAYPEIELLLQLLSSRGPGLGGDDALVLETQDATAFGSTDAFLHSRLRYTKDAQGQEICLLAAGDEEVGVMMGWEREISECSRLCASPGSWAVR